MSDDGAAWAFSNEPGFGVELNDTVTAMGSRAGYLYAGVFNGGGFEVWRRTPLLGHVLPSLLDLLRATERVRVDVARCLLVPFPCPPPWAGLLEPVAQIRLALDVVGDPDPTGRLKAARAAMFQVSQGIGEAFQLAAIADKLGDTREAHRLRHDATGKLHDAVHLAHATVHGLAKPAAPVGFVQPKQVLTD